MGLGLVGAPLAFAQDAPPPGQPGTVATYTSAADGYKLDYPSEMAVDESLAPIRVRFTGVSAGFEVYHQLLDRVSLSDYLAYSYKPILSGRDPVKVLKDEDKTVAGRRTRQLWWERPALKLMGQPGQDQNFYASVDISDGPCGGPDDVFTLLFKATSKEELGRLVPAVVGSFDRIPITATAQFKLPHTGERAFSLSDSAERLLLDYFGDGTGADRQSWGIFEPLFTVDREPLLWLETRLHYTFRFVVNYSSLEVPPPDGMFAQAAAQGRVVEETFQTLSLSDGPAHSTTYDILDGRYDDVLRSYARSIADFGGPVLFRLDNEMNGEWCGYCAYLSSKDPSLYVALWRHVFDLFREEGADNALWVWNPNDLSFPDFQWNQALLYYPGDEYVDIVGLTGYNTGTYYAGERWREFQEIYDPLYTEYTQTFPDKPLMITEFGSNSVGGDKVEWMRQAFARLGDYPRIKVAIWWSGVDWDGPSPARIYRLDETPATLKAFHDGLRHFE